MIILICLMIFRFHPVTTGTPVVSLYTNQTLSDPAALAGAILSSAVAAGQTPTQSSAPLMVTSQPLPNLTSVPVNLTLSTQDTAAGRPASSLTGDSQESLHLQSEAQATDRPPASTVTTEQPQVGCRSDLSHTELVDAVREVGRLQQ